jgi:hypothetical protein
MATEEGGLNVVMTVPTRLRRRLGALLGPVGPDIGCEGCFDELDRYVELELAGADVEALVPGMRAHLEGCPACAEEHASLAALLRE